MYFIHITLEHPSKWGGGGSDDNNNDDGDGDGVVHVCLQFNFA